MTNILYFAYGYNMCNKNINDRLSNCEFFNIGKIDNKKFICNKKSTDGSAKANLVDSMGDEVWGVLYCINNSQLKVLDDIESGYDREILNIVLSEGSNILAEVYVSSKTTEFHNATEEYKNAIIEGAIEHKLPDYYIDELKQITTL
jgi:gamma-glutamylcyclotransferase (GGCT)/AIG2-like uncharacterized protein YtfP